MTFDESINFLNETARFFQNLDTRGEDRAHWAYQQNALNCTKITKTITDLRTENRDLTERVEYLLSLNSDLEYRIDWLEGLVESLKEQLEESE